MEPIERWDYAGESLDETGLPAAPWPIVREWVDQARVRNREQGDVPEPDAIAVATVDADARPSLRVVLMRYLEPAGPGFFTNLESRKAVELQSNPYIAATLTWQSMFRAIRFEGTARQLDRDTVERYFGSRPWASRVGAWASAQSRPLASRAELEQRVAELEQRWPDTGREDDVPLPDGWGGFVVDCDRVELWAGRRSRLHDRLVYRRIADGDLSTNGAWTIERLQP